MTEFFINYPCVDQQEHLNFDFDKKDGYLIVLWFL